MRHINIYTDGACKNNPGPGGYGWVIVENDKVAEVSNAPGFRRTTNNRMEIRAVFFALSRIRELVKESRDTDVKVTVYSDSQLVVNTIEKGYARKKNKDLWDMVDNVLLALKDMNVSVSFNWVKGHADNPWNNLADQLAVKASLRADSCDTVYEEICREETRLARPVAEHIPEPEIVDVRFCNVRDRKNRRIEVLLTNGTVVNIIPTCAGFAQTECTVDESRITVDIAWKYVGWLNGRAEL